MAPAHVKFSRYYRIKLKTNELALVVFILDTKVDTLSGHERFYEILRLDFRVI